MPHALKILLLDHSAADAEIVERLLKKDKPHYQFSLAMDKETYVLALDQFKPDVILADNSLPQFSAAEALELSRRKTDHTPFIMFTGTDSEEFDTNIIKLGADDYVLKNRLTRLPVAIEAAVRQQTAEKEKLAAIEKLNLNEENYRNLVERISDGFIALDLNWRFTYVNKKAEQMFSRPPGYLIGKHVWTEFPEAIDKTFYKAYYTAMETQENSHLEEYSAILGLWIEANIYPSLSGISIYFRDITEQKKAEEKLKEKEEKYRTLVEHATDGIFIADANGYLLDVNSSLCSMVGAGKEEILKANLKDGLFKEDLKATPIGYELLKEGMPLLRERKLKRKDGSALYVEISSRMLPDGQIQGIIRDISERKKKEEELKKSEEKYRTLIERTSEGIVIYSLDGTILDFNHSSYTYVGYTKEEISKLNIRDFFFEEDLIQKPLSFDRLKAGYSTIDHRRLKRKDGLPVEMEISTTMLPDGTLMAFARDITERKKLEEQQRRNHEELATVYHLSNSLNHAGSLDEIFTEAMNSLHATIHADRTSILLFDSGGVMRFKAWQNLSEEYRHAVEGHSPWSKDTKNAEPIFITDTEEDPTVAPWLSHFKKEGIRALGFIPIMQNGNLLGKFMLYSNKPRKFTHEESRLAQNIASHVAFATERKKAEEDIRRSNERFETVIRATNDAIWQLDLLTNESWHNDTFLLLFGTTPKGTPIKPTVDLWRSKLHPDDRERVLSHLHKSYENASSVWADEFRFLRPDGSYGIFYDRGFIQRDESGKAIRMIGSMIDITELKNIQKQLKESEEKYRNLVEEASDAIFINDKQGNLLDANKSASTMLGYTKEEFCEMRVTDLYTSSELSKKPIMYKELLRGNKTSVERNMLHKDGSLIPVDITAKMLADGRIIAIVRDNSKRKKAEEDIRISNERFQTLSKATNDAVWDWDLINDQIWWSANLYTILGFDAAQPVPEISKWIEKIHPDERDQLLEKLKRAGTEHASSWEDEFRFQQADGSYGIALDRAYIISDDTGKPVRAIGVMMDITQRKRLIKEIEVLSIIAKETGNGVLIFEKETHLTLWINEGFTRLTGYTQEDIYGKDPTVVLYGPETDQHTIEYIRHRKANDLAYAADVLIYTKEGEKKWHYISGQPMPDENGQITKYFVLSTDISDRLRIEQERITNKVKRQKEITRAILNAQEAERNELGRELHDNINQILAVINLKLDYYIKNNNSDIKLIEDCHQNIQDAISETRSLSHRMVMPRFSESSLQHELAQLVANYQTIQTIQILTEHMEEKYIPATVKATLFRIVQEQLSNIQKHAKADTVVIRLRNDATLATMFIEDNGIGFDTQRKRKGIGISNILNRVELYNGTVEIVSSPGNGCTLSVNIPLTGLAEFATPNRS